jgi:hypothetical protein
MNIRVALGARPAGDGDGDDTRPRTDPRRRGRGTVAALSIGSIVASLLFEVQPRDPAIISGVIAVVSERRRARRVSSPRGNGCRSIRQRRCATSDAGQNRVRAFGFVIGTRVRLQAEPARASLNPCRSG